MNMNMQTYKINEEPNVIDDHLLDIIGASFNFDHVKGLSEWLKNSIDAYRRNGAADKDQYVYFRFTDGVNSTGMIECIDFNGMTEVDIEKALKRWGDPEASKGGNKSLRTFGGHGNGGKFYMRQMFISSHFITYKDGLMNVFGFSENKKYGFAEHYRNKKISPKDAIEFAGLSKQYISPNVIDRVLSGQTGFTVARGVGPVTMPSAPRVKFIVNHLLRHPQAQRILMHIPSKVIYNEAVFSDGLSPEQLKPLQGFEDIQPIQIPAKLVYKSHQDEEIVEMSNSKYPAGVLQLYTSEEALMKNSKHGDLNRIDVLGELGVIGSYKLYELGNVNYMTQSVFIYGEVTVPILEDPNRDSVQNDRSKLIENPTTTALLEWVSVQVIELCKKIHDKEQKERQEKMKDISSSLNSFMNQWKDKFMSKILADILVGEGGNSGSGKGGTGGGGTGGGSGSGGSGSGGTGGGNTGGGDDAGGGDKSKKVNRSPKVLLSSQDLDPFEPFETISLTPRHPAVYQRPKDYEEGIYWINTSSALAKNILERFDQSSPRWRDYIFQRYVDIFVKEALTMLEKNDPGDFTAASVEQTTSEVTQRIHQAAAEELNSFLFEDIFKPED